MHCHRGKPSNTSKVVESKARDRESVQRQRRRRTGLFLEQWVARQATGVVIRLELQVTVGPTNSRAPVGRRRRRRKRRPSAEGQEEENNALDSWLAAQGHIPFAHFRTTFLSVTLAIFLSSSNRLCNGSPFLMEIHRRVMQKRGATVNDGSAGGEKTAVSARVRV